MVAETCQPYESRRAIANHDSLRNRQTQAQFGKQSTINFINRTSRITHLESMNTRLSFDDGEIFFSDCFFRSTLDFQHDKSTQV